MMLSTKHQSHCSSPITKQKPCLFAPWKRVSMINAVTWKNVLAWPNYAGAACHNPPSRRHNKFTQHPAYTAPTGGK